jgi:hypothetical protein
LRVEVANCHHERVCGVVVAAIVVKKVIASDLAKVGFVADDHVAIRMGLKGGPIDFFVKGVSGVVFGALPLGQDDSEF